jgi:hypothetical protein
MNKTDGEAEVCCAARTVFDAFKVVLTEHYDSGTHEEPGAIDPEIAALRVMELLPPWVAGCISDRQSRS